MKTRIVSESELEIVNCPECGSDNVLTAPASCTECERWRVGLLEAAPHLQELVNLR